MKKQSILEQSKVLLFFYQKSFTKTFEIYTFAKYLAKLIRFSKENDEVLLESPEVKRDKEDKKKA